MVVEIDELVNQISGLLKGFDFLAVDPLCFEDGEKVFGHGVVIAVPPS